MDFNPNARIGFTPPGGVATPQQTSLPSPGGGGPSVAAATHPHGSYRPPTFGGGGFRNPIGMAPSQSQGGFMGFMQAMRTGADRFRQAIPQQVRDRLAARLSGGGNAQA